MIYTVYKVTNTKTGKVYIGRTQVELKKRRHWHHSNGKKLNTKFANALREFGHGSFVWETLLQTEDKEESYKLEESFIRSHNSVDSGYNEKPGDRIPWNKGKKLPKEYGEKTRGERNGMYGKTHSSEYKKWRSEHMSKIQRGTRNHMAKRVRCVELEREWGTVRECADELRIHKDAISHCCRGVNKTAGGYHFHYVTS